MRHQVLDRDRMLLVDLNRQRRIAAHDIVVALIGTGTEPAHGDRPDEVSVPALSSAQTTLTFDEPGDVVFICHFPGHEAYGMVGVLHVT